MDLTKQEILRKHLQLTEAEFQNLGKKNTLDAMEEYAEQEAKAYAKWLLNQVIAGRTMTKLWDDYRKPVK